ncbi:MAG TPA: TetR/AcrR family transcriptional regulator [Alphaproteobacteria bacterium]|nr:TetR/AcrR family transcriptional regulator [Alphaproteobacteria bacterium]
MRSAEGIRSSIGPSRRGGRPSQVEAPRIREKILDVATALILTHGYGATSIEAVAQRAGISKRTFYHRFNDKADLFGAVVHRLIERLRPPDSAILPKGDTFDEILENLAHLILSASLTPDALALYRVILSEATRFPKLAEVVHAQGARQEAVGHIAQLLERQAQTGQLELPDCQFAAEQFLQMVISVPQRRALGLGAPMSRSELDFWVRNTVKLFLDGCRMRLPQ